MKNILILISLLIMSFSTLSQAQEKTFIDYFLPTPVNGSLSVDVWGASQVGPRDPKNGLEDATARQWSYWDGQIIKGPDGRYHIFASRWDQAGGHMAWGNSLAVHAVSNNLSGPYVDKGLCWPDNQGGKGHNVTALVLPDGRYAVVLSETRPGDVFVSSSLDGPWEHLGQITVERPMGYTERDARLSNMSIMVRPDGDFMIVPRAGTIWISKTGILGPYKIMAQTAFAVVEGVPTGRIEDPVVWYSGGLYHIIANNFGSRTAYHLTSSDGITGWKNRGLAYDPRKDFVRYTDGTINHWALMERPGVVIENGHVVALTLAVLNVPKREDVGGDANTSKIIVIPFDGAALDRDLQKSDAAAKISLPSPKGPFEPTWESIQAHYTTPDWFKDSKFGIFMHWGLYSVPAHHSEWYVKYMYSAGEDQKWHIQNFGPIDSFGYKDFIPMFTATKWDPEAWAELFRKSGAKYVIPTAEHHDGFSLWDSELNKYNAKNMGPRRDLIDDLAKAVRAKGLKFGVSNHSMEHFTFIRPQEPDVKTDLYDPYWADFYSVADRSPEAQKKFLQMWVDKNLELIDKYQPDILWFDNGINNRNLDPEKLEVAAYYYNRATEWGKQVSLTTKSSAYLAGSITDYERQGRILPREIKNFVWQVDDPIGNKFGYVTEIQYKDAGLLVRRLIDCVSMNGNYLLNISPQADGTIPQEQQDCLLAIGRWLDLNGEAIYSTRQWIRYGEGPYYDAPGADGRGADDPPGESWTSREIRFTTRGDILYAIVMDWPDKQALITSLATGKTQQGRIEKVELLGHSGLLPIKQDTNGLKVTFPAEKPCDYAYVLKITGLKLK